ncbi:TonB-dependent receptor [Hymenobacter cellulosivorans]|uniref:Carboxypeptidase regulatory-like domain-containing protein n=1 Tax=Hymenobacter cellulosivorans TaxID=2932249 RepID=A0ABY4FF65_9BACT|nr:TonB-dependent receptor [Hymenobacter cellulosivorans]UOQ55153.1 carboxypeptidase regulatory-like domain-containing protein [Hymenobacter cellulosivorans]
MKHSRLRLLLLLVLTLLSAPAAWSQVTTSAMNGVITDKSGAGLPGATVIAVHTPTNTQYVAPTNSEGRFNIGGMRVGGPYSVRVTFIGYQETARDGIFLTLGQNLRLDINLSEATTELADVVVRGQRDNIINADRTGSVTSVQREQIERLPSISRSLNDFTRLTPQANGAAVGGGNNRQNNFTVDGSDFNNNFGIGGNLPAGGSPISLDAVEQLTVSVTPYDVRQSGFTGGAINAVTRSGTNNFSGSLYTYFRNQDFTGTRVGNESFDIQKSQFNQYGFRLGGPVIKDKVFFFVNAEIEKSTTPFSQRVAATPEARYGSNPNITRPLASELNGIREYLRNRYGYETGEYQGYDTERTRNKILARIDWNISQNHRFNVRYSQTEGKEVNPTSNSAAPSFPTGISRGNTTALGFQNSNYYQEANFYSFAAELNSTFGSTMSNTLRGTFTKQNDPRSSDSQIFPFVDILKSDGGNSAATPFTYFGYEPFTYGNLRDVEIYSFRDDFTWILANHNLTFGAQVDLSTTRNGFQRQGTSYYRFNSYDDFLKASNPDPAIAKTGVPTAFSLTYSLSPNFEQAFPTFKFGQYSFYAQDEYVVNPRFRVTGGLRLDYITFPEPLQQHKLIEPLVFAGGEKIDVSRLPESKILWSPRLGFNWDVEGNGTVQLRGGSGIFTGRIPYVWIVSQAGDAGLLQITDSYEGNAINTVPGGYRGFSPDPAFYRPATPPAGGTAIPTTTTSLDPNFKFPQTWKSSLAVDVKLPFGIVGSLEGIYNKDLNSALFRNPNLITPQALNIPGYPDNRLVYPVNVQDRYYNPILRGQPVAPGTAGAGTYDAIVLGNASKGYYWSATAKLEKQFASGLYASVAYVRSDARNLFDGGGDQPRGSWQNNPTVNGSNFPELSYASYVVPDRVIASVSYRKEYLNHLGTTLSLFYEGSQAGRFSYTYSTDVNRDGAFADLIYIPKDASEITFVNNTVGNTTFTPAEQSEAFFKYIEQDKYLSKHRGEYAERNGALLPWRSQFDVKLLQDIFTNIGDKRNTLQLSVDVFNLGNLLNKDWGATQTINTSSILQVSNANSVVANGTTRPTFRLNLDRNGLPVETFRNTLGVTSTYYLQLGLRYIFN